MLVPVKDAEFNDSIKAVMSVEPKMSFDKDKPKDAAPEQKINKANGLPVWVIKCAYKHPDDRSPDFAAVHVSQTVEPEIGDGRIRFSGLTCLLWKMTGDGGGSISAKSYTQDGVSNAKSSVPPKPSPAGAK